MQYASFQASQLTNWAVLNNVDLRGIKIEPEIVEDDDSKGGGILATSDHSEGQVLLAVPHELTISKDQIRDCARTDARLRELLDAMDGSDLIETTRGLFMIFLLYQLTLTSEGDVSKIGGVQNLFTDYVKFLPKEIPLPTFYSDEERFMLVGTSLQDALTQKFRGLERELDQLRAHTSRLQWARKSWWGLSPNLDEDQGDESPVGALILEDWKLVDAMYRSRGLELPNDRGIVMVPVLDMANHAPDDEYNARFEADQDGNVMLVVQDGKRIQAGQEINIMYGCGGACEMIFSYGFLDHSANSARELFLGLSIPSDDPLGLAKTRVANAAPGARLYHDQTGEVKWESDFVWWACVNEEDGLDFQVLQSNDGQKELRVVWKGHEFEAGYLKRLLMEDELWEVFVLRSLVLIQQRVEEQGRTISESEAMFAAAKHATGVRNEVWELVTRLRSLELELLTAAFEALDTQKAALLDSETIRRYLGTDDRPTEETGKDEVDSEDFS